MFYSSSSKYTSQKIWHGKELLSSSRLWKLSSDWQIWKDIYRWKPEISWGFGVLMFCFLGGLFWLTFNFDLLSWLRKKIHACDLCQRASWFFPRLKRVEVTDCPICIWYNLPKLIKTSCSFPTFCNHYQLHLHFPSEMHPNVWQ